MPLKIETGTYTVNPVIKKEGGSKFSLWKHWRRSVQVEDRGLEDWRRRRGPVHGEVAGLEEAGNGNLTVTLVSDSGGTGRAQRRTRPLSLAVQPLNYHRVDPEFINTRNKHPNMTSQESIGSCSLDVDQSTSDRSEKAVGSLSEKTLHSFNLSFNGEQTPSAENLRNGNSENQQIKHTTSNGKNSSVNNGHHYIDVDQMTVKKPSYLGLACSISGYSGITRYDSKLREGFRSRDSSPGARLITREASPVGFRSNENLNIPSNKGFPPKSQSISPLAMDRQNGYTNGTKNNGKIDKYLDNKSSINSEGYSEVDKGISLNSTYSEISPIRNNSTTKRSPGSVHIASYNQQNISYSSTISTSSPKPATVNVSNTSFSENSIHNGSSLNVDNHLLNSSSSSEKSFIQQRVERLYGPGALAQGFFFKRSSFNKSNTSDSSFNKSNIDNNTSIDNSSTEESLPVLRFLQPEFRAKLPVVHCRKPTDGSEQIIKPLQRLSVASAKNEAKEKSLVPEDVEKMDLKNNPLQLSSSTTSITDQQPAAPQVVLPVLESSTSNVKQEKEEEKQANKEHEEEKEQKVIEIEKAAVEKNGHYFMKLLKEERDKLILLAESAESELSSVDPSLLPEEAAGKLRSASGKARLLASQKMQQFEGLCHKNINKVEGEEFPTMNEDLEGFWDMLMLQVIQVNQLFEQLERSRKSQWQEVCQENSNPKSPPKYRKNSKIFKSLKGITFPKLLKSSSKEYNNNDSQNQLELAVGLNEKFSQEIKENFESKLKKNYELNDNLCDRNLLRLTPENENLFYSKLTKSDIYDETEFNYAEARSVLSQMENNFNLKMLRTKKRELRTKNIPDKSKSFSVDFHELGAMNSRKNFPNNRFNSMDSINKDNRSRSFSPEEKSIGDTILEGQTFYENDRNFNSKPSIRSRSLEARRKSKLNVTFADEIVFDVINYDENSLSEDEEKDSTASSILEDSEDQISSKNSENHFSKINKESKNNQPLVYHDLNRSQSSYRLQNIDFYSPIIELPENESEMNLESNPQISTSAKGIAFTIPMVDNSSLENENNKSHLKEKFIEKLKSRKIHNEGETKSKNCKSTEFVKFEKNCQNDKKRETPSLRDSVLRPSSSHKESKIDDNNLKLENNKTLSSNEKKTKKTPNSNSTKKEKQESRPSSVSSRRSQESNVTTRSKSLDRNFLKKDNKKSPNLPRKQKDSLKSPNSNETVIINPTENSTEKKEDKNSEEVTNFQTNKIDETKKNLKKNSLKRRVIDSLSKLKPKSSEIQNSKINEKSIKKVEEKNLMKKIDNSNNALVANCQNIETPGVKHGQLKNRVNNLKRSRVCSKSVSQSILPSPNIFNFPRYSKEAQRLLIKKYTNPVNLSSVSKCKFEKTKKSLTKKNDLKEITPNLHSLPKIEPNYQRITKSKTSNFLETIVDVDKNEMNSQNLQIVTYPLETSKFQEIQVDSNSLSLASFCDSETSMTRMLLETSRIIKSNSKVEEHFFANVLKRTNEECSLVKFNGCQSSNRENNKNNNTMIEICRNENYGFMKISSKRKIPTTRIIETKKIFNTTINIVPEKRTITGTLNGSTPKRRINSTPKIKATPSSEANKKAREAREQSRRQMIEERRRAMKSMTKNENNSVEIFIPET